MLEIRSPRSEIRNSAHSLQPTASEFTPLPEPAIRTGVKTMTAAAVDLLNK
jgi:hypothetical protein